MHKAKSILVIAGLLGALSVMLGAFAAHGLKAQLNTEMIEVFKTGVLYQFIHVFGLIACAVLSLLSRQSEVKKRFYRAAICFIIGIFCFSGSLYLLAITGIKWFGPITPLGGLMFIVGWVLFAFAAKSIDEVSA